jgi:hypothetical protein
VVSVGVVGVSSPHALVKRISAGRAQTIRFGDEIMRVFFSRVGGALLPAPKSLKRA